MNEEKKEILKIKEKIELIEVDIFDLNEDFNLHNSFFLAMMGGLIVILIGIFINFSNKNILFALTILLLICFFGIYEFVRPMTKINNKINFLSAEKKKLIKKKYLLMK